MTKTLHVPTIPWPFWCLALAWTCANMLPSTHLDLKNCLSSFRHFSHQSELADQTRALLHAEVVTKTAAVAKTRTTPATQPLVPGTNLGKKIELGSPAQGLTFAALPTMRHSYVTSSDLAPDQLRATPPHRPPRVTG